MSLGKKVFSSAFLLLIRKIWGNVVNLIVMAFLARLLSKEDFGLLAISSVFLSIINTVATSGIAEYVVYYDGEDKSQKINAAFWLNFILTLAVMAVVIVSGSWWADFYKNEKIYSLLLLLLIPFFFEMSATIPKAMLRKELEYKAIVYFSSISMTFVSVGKLMAAWWGFGVYSLVLPQAIASPLLMTAYFVKTKWRPMVSLGVVHFKSIFDYSKHIIGGRVLTKLVNEGDNLIVGKFIGMEGLGVYALAFQLANLVTANVVFIVNDIFQPLFGKVKNEADRLKNLYVRMIQFLGFLSFPLITVLCFCAEPLIYFLYGPKWLDAVVPLQILCAFSLGRSLSSPSSALFSAMGRPDIGFKFTAYFTPVFLIAVFFGSQFGIIGVAISTTSTRVIGSVISLSLSLNLIGLKLTDLFHSIKSNLIATIILMIVFLWIFFVQHENKTTILLFSAPMIFYSHYLIQRFLFHSEFRYFLSEIDKYMKGSFNLLRRIFLMKHV